MFFFNGTMSIVVHLGVPSEIPLAIDGGGMDIFGHDTPLVNYAT